MDNDLSIFNTSLTLRIDWSEMDLFGHVNNVMFFKYLQAARVNYWEKMGLYGSYRQTGIGPILASAKCDFHSPLEYPGNIVIYTRMDFMKTTSFGFTHQIRSDKGIVAATGNDVVVMYDFNTNKKTPVPPAFREAAEKIEQRLFPGNP